MIKAINIFLLVFYACVTFCLPMGDFSALNNVADMYRHCKATEDKDMTPLDFITDHLVNIDGLFDKHENGDEQKPHQPIQDHHYGQSTVFYITGFSFIVTVSHSIDIKFLIPMDNFLPSDHSAKVFRPPIFA